MITSKIYILLILILFLCPTIYSYRQTNSQDISKLKKVCEINKNVQVEAQEILRGRYPNAEALNVSATCKEQARKQIKDWIDEDIRNWQSIANRACSYELGWVEKKPNTCQAGGPPPICPVDHWERKPQEAKQRMIDDKAKIRGEREKYMLSQACGCLKNEMVVSRQKTLQESNSISQVYNPYTFDCKTWSCPPGMECKNNTCVPVTGYSETAQTIGELKDQTKSIITDEVLSSMAMKAIEKVSKSLADALKSKSFKIIGGAVSIFGGIFETTTMSKWTDGYNRGSEQIGTNLTHIRSLYGELNNYRLGLPSRAPKQIENDILKAKIVLRENLDYLNTFYSGVIREREIGKYECQNVFEYQHQLVNEAVNNLISLPNGFLSLSKNKQLKD
ncbi:MAG: hypothetical protein AB1757_21280 [Acidobacteriota bacterium]